MSGEVECAASRLRALAGERDPKLVVVRDSLLGMVSRAEALMVAGVELGEHALTAWHAAINGTLLVHESPHGYDEPMRGRYAYVGDSPGLMREGIERLCALLAHVGNSPERVVHAPDRASAILGAAVGLALDRPCVPWSPDAAPTLTVAWSLETVHDFAFLEAHRQHRRGELLFAHVSSWVDPFPYAPDVTTYLYQTVTNFFTGGALRVDPATREVSPAPPDERDAATLADGIMRAELGDPSHTPLDVVLGVERALRSLPEAHQLGIHRSQGDRARQRCGSPVVSARFA